MSKRIYFFDTTLRDGEQSPGVSLNIKEKLEIARQLSKLGVDVIEAGFPIASPGDFAAVQAIAREIKGSAIAGLCRAGQLDIDRAWEAIKEADQPRIHTFIATSDIHLKHKLQKSREEVLEKAFWAVKYAKQFTADVEFSAEDSFRSDMDYLCQVVEAVINAGATTVNLPDTVGYATPEEFGQFIAEVRSRVPNIDKTIISVHCHNDLGLAVANSLAAIRNGAQQVECTINGIGERAGNAALEEIVMGLYTRQSYFQKEVNINYGEIFHTSRLVSSLTGMKVQANKAVVGKNAFAHESGIHQDGVLKERTTYEIMNPKLIGIYQDNIVLGKHSGRHAFKDRLIQLGYQLDDQQLDSAFKRFKDLADRKKELGDEDLRVIVEGEMLRIRETYVLEYFHISSGSNVLPTGTVRIRKDDEAFEEAACGDGPVDAIYKAIEKITGWQATLVNYAINAVTGGEDALGEVVITIKDKQGNTFVGRSASTDVLEASARAYIDAGNKLEYEAIQGHSNNQEREGV